MELTLREKIMLEVVSRLQSIQTPAYSQDVKVVERAVSEIPDVNQTPCIYVFEEGENKDGDYAFNKKRCMFPVMIVYIVTATNNLRPIANAMLGDITKALGTEVGLVDSLENEHRAELIEVGNEVQTDNTGSPLLIVGVEYTVRYSHKDDDQTFV